MSNSGLNFAPSTYKAVYHENIQKEKWHTKPYMHVKPLHARGRPCWRLVCSVQLQNQGA